MRLYYSPTSPYVRKVTVLIQEAGIDGVERVAAAGTPTDPGTMPIDRNPLGKVPALDRPDGATLYDSPVICRYLDALSGAGFYPPAPRLWETLTLEATADGMLDAALLMVYEARIRPEDKRYDPWVEAQWAKVDRALDAVESRWMPHLTGPMDVAHIAMGCALGYLDFRLDARNWRQDRPHLAAWDAVFSQRPSMLATRPAT
jgi:glutathione S-transferase